MILLNAFEIFNLNQLSFDLSSNQFKCFGFHDANILIIKLMKCFHEKTMLIPIQTERNKNE